MSKEYEIRFQGLLLVPSKSTMRELIKNYLDLNDVKEILETGVKSPRKRKEGTLEVWKNKGNKTYEVVVIKDYNENIKEEVWLIIHIGKFGRKNTKSD